MNLDNMEVVMPGNRYAIKELYAWLSIDEEGREGILAYEGEFKNVPLVGADLEVLKAYKPYIRMISKKAKNTKVRLIRFKYPEVLDEVN